MSSPSVWEKSCGRSSSNAARISPSPAALATIVVERIFDAVVVIGFVLLNLGQLVSLPGGGSLAKLGSLATWAAAIFLAGLVVFILIAVFPKPAQRILHQIIEKFLPEKWRKSVTQFADRFLDGLMSLRSPANAFMVLFTSILIWLLETGLYWSVNQALGMDLNFRQLMLLNGVVNLVLLIPAAPGGLGTFDAAGRAMLEAYTIPQKSLWVIPWSCGLRSGCRSPCWAPSTSCGKV